MNTVCILEAFEPEPSIKIHIFIIDVTKLVRSMKNKTFEPEPSMKKQKRSTVSSLAAFESEPIMKKQKRSTVSHP